MFTEWMNEQMKEDQVNKIQPTLFLTHEQI